MHGGGSVVWMDRLLQKHFHTRTPAEIGYDFNFEIKEISGGFFPG